MQPLKKYFTDGLIQVAIVLSLAGMHVDVDPYLPLSHNINIESPGLTQYTQGYGPYIKRLDVESSFPVPRWYHWVRSLRHLHIPTAQLDTWLVHSETDNSAINLPNLTGAWDGGNELADMEDSANLNMRIGGDAIGELENNSDVDDSSLGAVTSPLRSQIDIDDVIEHANEFSLPQQEAQNQYFSLLNDDYDDDLMINSWRLANPFHNPLTSLRDVQEENSLSTEECLQILEAGIPLEHVQNLVDLNPIRDEDPLQYHSSLHSSLSQQDLLLDLEQQWQDVLAVMEPQDINMDDALYRSHFTNRDRTRTPIQQNLSIDQPTFSRSSPFSSNTDNLNFNDPGIVDFLLPTPENLNTRMPSFPMEDPNQSSHFLKEVTNVLDQAIENKSEVFQNENQIDSDSGLSLDYSQSLVSPSRSESSFCSSSSNSSSSTYSIPEDEALGSTIKEEPMDEEGAVGGYIPMENKMSFTNDLQFQYSPWLEHIDHDHTYNQLPYTNQRKYTEQSLEYNLQDKLFNRDEKRARDMRIPFSTDYIINLPVDEFNELLAKHRLSEAQLALIRDIRRRGKNKVAAQNCRRRKLNVLQDLERSVDGLRRHRARLLREKSDVLCSVREMKQRLNDLYQEVRNRLEEVERIPCSAMDITLQPSKDNHVSSTRKSGKKQKDKECR